MSERKEITRKKEGLCDICKNWKRAIKDHEKKCKGKPKEVAYESCRKCYKMFSKSNIKRHEESCGGKHKIRRKERQRQERIKGIERLNIIEQEQDDG